MSEPEKIRLTSGLAQGDALHIRRWPIASPKAVALLSHGYGEHIGRYEHVAAALNAAGFAVFAVDHWGHGLSDGVRGFAPGFSVFLDGQDALLAEAKAAYPDLKRFLIGHSMGGLIAADHLLTRQSEYAGAVLSGPALKPVDEQPAIVLAIGRLLSRLAPKAGLIGLDASLVSRDPAVVAAYRADPLVFKGKISARLGAEMLDAMARVNGGAGALSLPLLLLHGGADGLTAPEGSRQLFEKISSSDKTLTIHDGFYHEIFNDPGKERVIAAMIDWLGARAA